MNEKINLLLSCLRENSREKLTSISKKTNIPISTLFDTLRELQGGVIRKSTILVDFFSLGYHSHAQIFLKVNKMDKERIIKHFSFNEDINSVYKTNNGWDFIIETIHKNVKELDQFLGDLENKFQIENHQIHYLIDEIIKEKFMVENL